MNTLRIAPYGLALAVVIAALPALPAFATTVEAGPIRSQAHAELVCPTVARVHGGTWNGQWWTTIPGRMSVCQLETPARAVEAGPIWNQQHANQVCPAIAQSHGAEWTGHWWTTVAGEMSVCQIR